ncbi:hypothetical protein [Enterococcus thailandicus]|nr:hypothetical protein [Enterococcus thailandicus]MDA3974197.1 hypothetical protein [Enterococcus thailandicus]MDK4353505.1 hypothetical protein [Enterococcus thailandicus]
MINVAEFPHYGTSVGRRFPSFGRSYYQDVDLAKENNYGTEK